MIEQEIYISTVNKITELTNEKISREVYMTEIQLAKEFIKYANESEENIIRFLKENNQEVVNFSVKRLQLITDDNEQDENDDYILGDDEDDEMVSLGLSKTFLIDDIIELILIKKGDDSLEKYLKKIRIPNAEKHAKELRDIYDSIKEI
jgi:hypothetical protein